MAETRRRRWTCSRSISRRAVARDEPRAGDGGLSPEEEQALALRSEQVECALKIVAIVSADAGLPIDLRARASYLAGNLRFLQKEYQLAVENYDRALKLVPGMEGDAGDPIGRDAAWNRAIALRRIEDEQNQQDAGQDAQPDRDDASPDSGDDGGDSGSGDDGGQDAGQDGGGSSDQSPDSGAPDAGGKDSGQSDDQGQDAGAPPEPPPEPQQSASQDERMLDMLERAPTLQQEAAKNRALMREMPPGMVDK